MKKYHFLVFALLYLGIGISNAQYKVLFNFDSANGDWPNHSLTISGKTLYGTAAEGGANGNGCIFSIDTNGNNYRDLFDFSGTTGKDPDSPLILEGKVFYGVTALGGAYNIGCIFSIDTNGLGYKDMIDFNGTNGEGGQTSLTPCGKMLYGTTYTGGVGGNGRIFSIDTNGTGYRDLLDSNVGGTLSLSGGLFYGVSTGVNGFGSIFSVDTNGQGYRDLFDFVDTNGGPWYSLTLSDGLLYGAASGDTNYEEYLFSIDTNGNKFKDIYKLPSTYPFPPGPNPNCPFVVSGKMLYIITSYGGIDLGGNVFSLDTNGTSYKDMFDLAGVNGEVPFCSLIISGGTLYGVTSQGGTYGYGVVFKIDTSAISSTNNLVEIGGETKLFPNPNFGQFTMQLSVVSGQSSVEIYNVLGEKVYSETLRKTHGNNLISLGEQPSGVYFYKVFNDKEIIGTGKIMVDK